MKNSAHCWRWATTVVAAFVVTTNAWAAPKVVEYVELGDMGIDDSNGSYCIDVSADASVVLGITADAEPPGLGRTAFLYEGGQVIPLPDFDHVYALSADGKVVVGNIRIDGSLHAAVYRDGEYTLLPESPATTASAATVVTSDGAVIGGYIQEDSSDYQTVLWHGAGPVSILEGLSFRPTGISADGTKLVGVSYLADGFHWNLGDVYDLSSGAVMSLEWPQDDHILQSICPWAISADGHWIAGTWEFSGALSANFTYPILWFDGVYKPLSLESVPYSTMWSRPSSISGDGSKLVGQNWQNRDEIFFDDGSSITMVQDLLKQCSPGYLEPSATYNEIGPYDHEDMEVLLGELYGGPAISEDGTTVVGSYLVQDGSTSRVTGIIVRIEDMWGHHILVDGYLYLANWGSWLDLQFAPWAYCLKTQCWFYIPEPVAEADRGWIYATDLSSDGPEMWLVMISGSSWGWSYGLGNYVYVSPEALDAGQGWIYVQL